jgi:hypothetical protein
MALLATKGLSAAAPILEDYGLSCENDMSLLDEDDLMTLCSKLKQFPSKLLRKWVQGLADEHGGAAGEQEGLGDGKIDRDVRIIAPNSCPPESVFSMFNATFGEDQSRSFGDYLVPAMQSQYNKRNL